MRACFYKLQPLSGKKQGQDLRPHKMPFLLNCQLFAQPFSGHGKGALEKECVTRKKQEWGESPEGSQRAGDCKCRNHQKTHPEIGAFQQQQPHLPLSIAVKLWLPPQPAPPCLVRPALEACCCVEGMLSLSCIQLIAILWTVAQQGPLSKGFSRQEYCSGLPWPPPGDLPDPGLKPASSVNPALQADS